MVQEMSVICTKFTNINNDVKFIDNFFFPGGTIFGFVSVSSFSSYWHTCVCYLSNLSVSINPILYYMNEIVRYYCISGYLSVVNINRVYFTLTGSLPAPECHSYSHAPPGHSSSLHIQYVHVATIHHTWTITDDIQKYTSSLHAHLLQDNVYFKWLWYKEGVLPFQG